MAGERGGSLTCEQSRTIARMLSSLIAAKLATIERAAIAGADNFVAGSAVFRAEDAHREVEALRELANAHTH